MKSCKKLLVCSCALMPLIAVASSPWRNPNRILDGGPGPGPKLPPQHNPDRTVRPVRPSAPAVQTLDTAKIVCRIRELSKKAGEQLYELWNKDGNGNILPLIEGDLDKLRCYLGSLHYFTDFKNTDESVLNEYVLWSGLRYKKIEDFKKKVSKESYWRKLDEMHKEIILKAELLGISRAEMLERCIYDMFSLDAKKKQDAEIMSAREDSKQYIAIAIEKLSDSVSKEQLKKAYGLQ